MDREKLLTLLLAYTVPSAAAILVRAGRNRRRLLLAFTAVSAGLLALTWTLAWDTRDGTPVLVRWSERWTLGHVAAAISGLFLAVPWILVTFRPPPLPRRETGLWQNLIPLVCLAGAIGPLLLQASRIPARDVAGLPNQITPLAPDLTVEFVSQLPGVPIRVHCATNNRVFVAFTDYATLDGRESGGICEVFPGRPTSERVRVIAKSTALWRVYGLTERDGDLYVSRSGRMVQARDGILHYANAGSITRLQDLNGDGLFEYFHDVVTNLPGSQGPIAQHQNNALLFQPDGSLLVASGNSGDREPSHQPWEGAIIEFQPDFTQSTIYAEGFRNPFSMDFGPDGDLFVVDQDTGVEGDELNVVARGAHLGHPFVVGRDRVPGFTPPVLLADPESNFVSVVHAKATTTASSLRGKLLVTDLFRDRVLSVETSRVNGEVIVGAVVPVARIPQPTDLGQTADGWIYVISRDRNLYRIGMKKDPA